MNKEEIINELSRISTPTGITPSGDYTLSDYTCDEILNYIDEQDQQNTNLKQALNEIREYVNENSFFVDDTGYKKVIGYPKEKFNAQDILQIIDKVLGDDDSEK